MRALALSALLACILAAPPAFGGAWLQEKGASFTSFSLSTSWLKDTRSSGYLEFGITETSTVGIDLGLSRNRTGRKLAYSTLFLRRAVGPEEGPNRFAYEVGLGATYAGTGTGALAHLKTGLSWGRGVEFGQRSGWMSADGAVLWGLQKDNHVYKVDTTVGMTLTDRFTGMLQLNFARQEGETFSYFEPSIIYSPRNSGLEIQVGVTAPLDRLQNTSLKLGLWHKF